VAAAMGHSAVLGGKACGQRWQTSRPADCACLLVAHRLQATNAKLWQQEIQHAAYNPAPACPSCSCTHALRRASGHRCPPGTSCPGQTPPGLQAWMPTPPS
jgi:hypothetical protein